MTKLKFSPSQLTSGLVIPLLVLAIAALGYLLLWPKYQDLQAGREVLKQKRQEENARQSQLADIQKLVEDFKSKREELLAIEEALPQAPRIPELLANFDYLSTQSGLLIDRLNVSLPAKNTSLSPGREGDRGERWESVVQATEDLGVIDIDLTLKGQYTNLKAFLNSLEQNLRLLDVTGLVLGSVSEGSPTQEYLLKMQTYYQKE